MIKKKSRDSSFRLTYLILGLTCLGLGASWIFKTYSGKNAQSTAGRLPAGFAMPVEVSGVKQETIYDEVVTVGTMEGDASVMVRPEIAGRVADIGFHEGQKVSKGDLLVKLDDSICAASVAESEANLSFSEAQNQRQNSLYKQNYTSGGKKDEAISKFKVDEAVLKRKKAELEKTRILAPFDGIIGLRKINLGDYLQAGQDIAMLVNLDPIKIQFSLPEIYLLNLKVGQKIEITSDIFPDKKFVGEILAIDPVINESGRNIQVKGKLPNPGLLLKPGMFVRVKVILEARENSLLIPEEALVSQGDHHFVYKVIEGKAKFTQVHIGMRRKAMVEIRQGLSAHDKVITAGQIKINDGMPVKIVPEQKSKNAL